MKLIQAIKDIIFKVKDYDRLEHDYSCVLGYVTGDVLSKTCYKLEYVYKAIQYHLEERDKWVIEEYLKEQKERP